MVEPVKKAEQIYNNAFVFIVSKALLVALHMNVFTNLSSGAKSAKTLAEEAGVPENRMTTILTALNAIGLLVREGDKYTNSPGAESFWFRAPAMISAIICATSSRSCSNWKAL